MAFPGVLNPTDTCISGLIFGIGLLSIFQGATQYMIDAYGPMAASAVCTVVVFLTEYS